MPSGGQNKKFSEEVFERAIDLFLQGTLVTDVAKIIGVNVDTLQRWRLNNPSFDSECSRAQSLGYEVQADNLVKIAETVEDVNRARLQSDNIKWLLARRAPDRYGDRIQHDVNHSFDIKGAKEDALARRDKLLQGRCTALPTTRQVIDITPSLTQSSTDRVSVEGDAGDADQNNLFDIFS